MVSGKGYKGGSVGPPAPHPKQYRKIEQNTAGNESFTGATLTGAERRMEG